MANSARNERSSSSGVERREAAADRRAPVLPPLRSGLAARFGFRAGRLSAPQRGRRFGPFRSASADQSRFFGLPGAAHEYFINIIRHIGVRGGHGPHARLAGIGLPECVARQQARLSLGMIGRVELLRQVGFGQTVLPHKPVLLALFAHGAAAGFGKHAPGGKHTQEIGLRHYAFLLAAGLGWAAGHVPARNCGNERLFLAEFPAKAKGRKTGSKNAPIM